MAPKKKKPARRRKRQEEEQEESDDEEWDPSSEQATENDDAIQRRAPQQSTTNELVSPEMAIAWASKDATALMKFKGKDLKGLCEYLGEKVSGTKGELVERVTGVPNIALLAKMKREGEYLPRDDSCGTAILVAMEMAYRRFQGPNDDFGMCQSDIMAAAEALHIYKGSLYDVTPQGYDGWSCTETLLARGLMTQLEPDYYTLGNVAVAQALHMRAHLIGTFTSSSPPPASEATRQLNAIDLGAPPPDALPPTTPPVSPGGGPATFDPATPATLARGADDIPTKKPKV